MAKVKVQRSSPTLDMTPMVDLAFLLVTFFMLTTNFSPDEMPVDMPSSISEIKMPETDILTITVSKEGKVFFDLNGQNTRHELINKISAKYGLEFTAEEMQEFAVMSGFGVPIGNLKEYLNMDREARKNVLQPGIPVKLGSNELADWVVLSRVVNPKIRIAIKGDRQTGYPAIKRVMETLIDNKVNRFNLITTMEKSS